MPPRKRVKREHSSERTNATPSSSAQSPVSHLEPYDVSKTHRLLEPGPVVLVSTSHNGANNLMTMGFHMCVQHDDPPLIGVCIGPWDHSYAALKATGECVIAVPGVDLAKKVVDIGNCSGDEIDKWAKFGFTPLSAQEVSAPLVSECLASIECKVHDKKNVSKYNLWILEPVQAWVNNTREEKRTFHHKGDGTFVADGDFIDLQNRMTKWKYLQD